MCMHALEHTHTHGHTLHCIVLVTGVLSVGHHKGNIHHRCQPSRISRESPRILKLVPESLILKKIPGF